MQVEQRHRDHARALADYAGFKFAADHLDMAISATAEAFARFEASLPPSAPVDLEQAKIDQMLHICRGALLAIRDWQGETKTAMYRVPEGFQGSPFGYLRKLANDGLKASARIAWGIEALATPSVLAESTSNDCLLVAEGWQDEAGLADQGCRIPPNGWHCTRERGHDGPCAAHRVGRPLGAGWSPVPQGEATHDERLTDDELSALGLGVSEWAYKHLARGYAVSLSVREIKRLIAALSRTPAVTDLSGVGVG